MAYDDRKSTLDSFVFWEDCILIEGTSRHINNMNLSYNSEKIDEVCGAVLFTATENQFHFCIALIVLHSNTLQTAGHQTAGHFQRSTIFNKLFLTKYINYISGLLIGYNW